MEIQSLILFIWRCLFYLCYLVDLQLVLKFQISFVIYIYIIFTFYLAEAFIQSDLQIDHNLIDNRSNQNQQRAIICNKLLC